MLGMLCTCGFKNAENTVKTPLNPVVLRQINDDSYTKEDFLNEWNNTVRPTDDFDPCSGLSRSQFESLKQKLHSLSEEDQTYVLSQKDGNTSLTIGETFKTLEKLFSQPAAQSRGDGEISESAAIGIIISVSLVGMTAICVFYMFKTKEIID